MADDTCDRPVGALPASLCVLASGLCALVYQTVWLREFRLFFGASTPASAAVLAIFMAGLGVGSFVLGPRADRVANPFRFYARLEFGIALSAALTPALLWLARQAYLALGGTFALGMAAGTGVRLILATVVLGLPTFLMGGTLPAVARAVPCEQDGRRRRVALLYGANTLGAVVGTLLATFVLFEHWGHRLTLWTACAVNLAVAGAAWWLARRTNEPSQLLHSASASEAGGTEVSLLRGPEQANNSNQPIGAGTSAPGAAAGWQPAWFVLPAAAAVGFAFFLLELVWYRMLAPLLGGSTFTFGLILALALAGIAVGSLAYAFWGAGRPVTLTGLAAVCALEAFCVAMPLALGDRVAMLAIALQGLGAINFPLRVLQWAVVAGVVVVPTAVVAGAQFPMLIALLGRDRATVGRHTAWAYGWNTAGAIAGALAGGFGLLPWLTAPGAWRLVVGLLLGVAGAALAVAGWEQRRANLPVLQPAQARAWLKPCTALGLGIGAVLCLTATGPTAGWRHSPVGAGRVRMTDGTANDFQSLFHTRRRILQWEADGRESSVALIADDGYAFVVNGKVDGNARGDASTQVMHGLLAALVHPAPRRSLVIGLGTGSTAGWLADVPGMERVDVVELEPAILKVAEFCTPVNRRALANPRVRVWLGDAREYVLTSREQYDVIASEPSNPYRAGVASLFTREFYEAAARRLRPGGILSQWVQAYEVDGETVSSALATLGAVFPVVECWKTQHDDLLFLATRAPLGYDAEQMRRRLAQEPFRSALALVWRVTDLEGVFGHYVANTGLARAVAAEAVPLATDDKNGLEFAFARTVGRTLPFTVETVLQAARELGFDRPTLQRGELEWSKVYDRRVSAYVLDRRDDFDITSGDERFRARTEAKAAYARGDLDSAARLWLSQPQAPQDLLELVLVAESLAEQGDDRARPYLDHLRAWVPTDADAVEARWWYRREQLGEAQRALEKVLLAWRQDPWAYPPLMERTLELARHLSRQEEDRAWQARLFQILEQPFVLRLLELDRLLARLELGWRLDELGAAPRLTASALADLEPHPVWTRQVLSLRLETYSRLGDPLAQRAAADLARFEAGEIRPFRYLNAEALARSEHRPAPTASPLPAPRVHGREAPAAALRPGERGRMEGEEQR